VLSADPIPATPVLRCTIVPLNALVVVRSAPKEKLDAAA